MTKSNSITRERPRQSTLAKAVEALIERAGSLVDAIVVRPQPVLVPVRVKSRRPRG